MQWSDISFNPPPSTLRQFAGVWLVIFAGLAVFRAFKGQTESAWILAALALVVGLPGLVRPALVRLAFVGATLLTFPLGWLVSKIVLACLFFGLFTPVALAFRLFGRDVHGRRPQAGRESYWTAKPMPGSVDRYFRPF